MRGRPHQGKALAAAFRRYRIPNQLTRTAADSIDGRTKMRGLRPHPGKAVAAAYRRYRLPTQLTRTAALNHVSVRLLPLLLPYFDDLTPDRFPTRRKAYDALKRRLSAPTLNNRCFANSLEWRSQIYRQWLWQDLASHTPDDTLSSCEVLKALSDGARTVTLVRDGTDVYYEDNTNWFQSKSQVGEALIALGFGPYTIVPYVSWRILGVLDGTWSAERVISSTWRERTVADHACEEHDAFVDADLDAGRIDDKDTSMVFHTLMSEPFLRDDIMVSKWMESLGWHVDLHPKTHQIKAIIGITSESADDDQDVEQNQDAEVPSTSQFRDISKTTHAKSGESPRPSGQNRLRICKSSDQADEPIARTAREKTPITSSTTEGKNDQRTLWEDSEPSASTEVLPKSSLPGMENDLSNANSSTMDALQQMQSPDSGEGTSGSSLPVPMASSTSPPSLAPGSHAAGTKGVSHNNARDGVGAQQTSAPPGDEQLARLARNRQGGTYRDEGSSRDKQQNQLPSEQPGLQNFPFLDSLATPSTVFGHFPLMQYLKQQHQKRKSGSGQLDNTTLWVTEAHQKWTFRNKEGRPIFTRAIPSNDQLQELKVWWQRHHKAEERDMNPAHIYLRYLEHRYLDPEQRQGTIVPLLEHLVQEQQRSGEMGHTTVSATLKECTYFFHDKEGRQLYHRRQPSPVEHRKLTQWWQLLQQSRQEHGKSTCQEHDGQINAGRIWLMLLQQRLLQQQREQQTQSQQPIESSPSIQQQREQQTQSQQPIESSSSIQQPIKKIKPLHPLRQRQLDFAKYILQYQRERRPGDSKDVLPPDLNSQVSNTKWTFRDGNLVILHQMRPLAANKKLRLRDWWKRKQMRLGRYHKNTRFPSDPDIWLEKFGERVAKAAGRKGGLEPDKSLLSESSDGMEEDKAESGNRIARTLPPQQQQQQQQKEEQGVDDGAQSKM